jgi:hypothetical protein
MHIYTETESFSSSVKFKNGDTEGKQNIRGECFNTLVEGTKNFIDSLDE